MAPLGAFLLGIAMNEVVEIKKSDAKQRVVFGELYAPDRPDADGEYMDSETIRKMSYKFMQEQLLHQIDHMHTNELVDGAHVVESFIVRKGDPDFIEGAWVVGVHIPKDEDWAKVEKGEWNGFSIEALVRKEEVEVEIDIPPVIEGMTLKSEDGHDHKFYVSYDDQGQFLGGMTDVVNGHSHKIVRGTVTETEQNHSHRFSHLENLQIGG